MEPLRLRGPASSPLDTPLGHLSEATGERERGGGRRNRGRGHGASTRGRSVSQHSTRPRPSLPNGNVTAGASLHAGGLDGGADGGGDEGNGDRRGSGVWSTAETRRFRQQRQRRDRTVFGRGTTAVAGLRGAPRPPRYVWLGRVISGNEADIQTHMKDRGINIKGIAKVSHQDAKYHSFKINIDVNDETKVLDSEFWPSGMICKRWWKRDMNISKDRPENGEENPNSDQSNQDHH